MAEQGQGSCNSWSVSPPVFRAAGGLAVGPLSPLLPRGPGGSGTVSATEDPVFSPPSVTAREPPTRLQSQREPAASSRQASV